MICIQDLGINQGDPLQHSSITGLPGVSDPRGSHVFGCRSAAFGDDLAGSGVLDGPNHIINILKIFLKGMN